MTTNYHTAIAAGAAANASVINGPLAQLDAALGALAAALASITFDDAEFSGTVTAAAFVGDGSGLTGIGSGTGGVINTGSTTIGADSDGNGVGVIALQTGGVTRMTITADGEIQLGEVVPTRTHAVYALGDSITYSPYYTGKLAELLGAGWAVRNCGIGGNTTAQMYARLAAQITNAGDGEYITVLGGINDVLLDASAATIEANLQDIYDDAAAAGLTVIAVTLLPFKAHASWTSGRQAVLDDVNSWILNTAANVDVRVDAYSVFESAPGSDTLAAAYDNGDGLHPNNAGSELLGTTVYNAATWTPSTVNATLDVATVGTIGLNQSLLTTDDVTFHNLFLSGTLDMPIWRPLTDSTTALKIANAAGVAAMTFDTTNLAAGIGTDPDADTGLLISRADSGTGNVWGEQIRALKIDASGTVSINALEVTAYNYALAASSTVAGAKAVTASVYVYAATGQTGTITDGIAVNVQAPSLEGAGTKVITTQYGISIANQGAAGVGTAYGLYIADQTGASDNYAIRSWSGKHLFGDSDATIGFYGTAPIAQAVLATGAGKTVDNVITALQNLGLVKQS